MIGAAEKYDLPGLKKMCESVLTQQVRMDNAIDMYKLGSEVKSTSLMRRAFAVLKA